MATANYSLLNQTFIWNGVGINAVKSYSIAPMEDMFSAQADNSSGDVIFIKNPAHAMREITFTTSAKSTSNTFLQIAALEGSTGVFAHYDNTGTCVEMVEGKLMKTNSGAEADPVDREWKVIGKFMVEIE